RRTRATSTAKPGQLAFPASAMYLSVRVFSEIGPLRSKGSTHLWKRRNDASPPLYTKPNRRLKAMKLSISCRRLLRVTQVLIWAPRVPAGAIVKRLHGDTRRWIAGSRGPGYRR